MKMKKIATYFGAVVVLACLSSVAIIGQTFLTTSDKKVITDFEKRTKKYIKLRSKAARGIPTPSKYAKAEEIAKHKTALQQKIQTARSTAKQGQIFTPAASVLIRRIIKEEFVGYQRSELRQTVLDSDTKGIPLKINLPYPESRELIAMSPTLLIALPQIPEQLRYRYIGRSLVLLDRDTGLIIDFMREALP